MEKDGKLIYGRATPVKSNIVLIRVVQIPSPVWDDRRVNLKPTHHIVVYKLRLLNQITDPFHCLRGQVIYYNQQGEFLFIAQLLQGFVPRG